MPVIEILTYSPKNDMDELENFFISGKPDGQEGFETDDQGRMKVGVLRWLLGREVTEAHFFSTPLGHPMKLLMGLVERPESREVPWMFIPGIEDVIRIDGVIGNISDFLPISDLLTGVVPNQKLDDAFVAERAKVQEVVRRIEETPTILSISKAAFLRTLRSEKGTNPKAVFAEVQSKVGMSL
jgi:hypothetical protein